MYVPEQLGGRAAHDSLVHLDKRRGPKDGLRSDVQAQRHVRFPQRLKCFKCWVYSRCHWSYTCTAQDGDHASVTMPTHSKYQRSTEGAWGTVLLL